MVVAASFCSSMWACSNCRCGYPLVCRHLCVLLQVAASLTQEKVSSLLHNKKLILVLDLDNTLIHASETPPPPGTLAKLHTIAQIHRNSLLNSTILTDVLYSSLPTSFVSELERFEGRGVTIDTDRFPKVALIHGEDLTDSLRCPDDQQMPHYRHDAENDPTSRARIAVLESSVFLMKTAIFLSRHSILPHISPYSTQCTLRSTRPSHLYE